MVRKIKPLIDKRLETLTNPKKAQRKYKKVLEECLKENGLTLEEFNNKLHYKENEYVDTSTIFTLVISAEMLNKNLETVERICLKFLSKELLKEEILFNRINAEYSIYEAVDVVFFETMLGSPNNEKMFKKLCDIIPKKTNIIPKLKEKFPGIENQIPDFIKNLFCEENRNKIMEEMAEVLKVTKDLTSLSLEESNEKYVILNNGFYLVSDLKNNIFLKFLIDKQNKELGYKLDLVLENENIKVKEKIHNLFQKNIWFIQNQFFTKKEVIEEIKNILKPKIKVSGFLIYKPKLDKKELNYFEYFFNLINGNKIFMIEDKNKIIPNDKSKKLLFNKLSENLQKASILKKDFKDCEIKFDRFKKEEISIEEDNGDVELDIFNLPFEGEICQTDIDLSWYDSTKNTLSVTKEEIEKFKKQNKQIEAIVQLTIRKKM